MIHILCYSVTVSPERIFDLVTLACNSLLLLIYLLSLYVLLLPSSVKCVDCRDVRFRTLREQTVSVFGCFTRSLLLSVSEEKGSNW
jgi:hypothetical protein